MVQVGDIASTVIPPSAALAYTLVDAPRKLTPCPKVLDVPLRVIEFAVVLVELTYVLVASLTKVSVLTPNPIPNRGPLPSMDTNPTPASREITPVPAVLTPT